MKKFFSVILLFNFVGVITLSCESCPPEKHTDFKSIKVRVEDTNVKLYENLKFKILRDNIIYLTSLKSTMNFGGALYAFTPCEPGYMGEKYEIVKVSIKSDRNFSTDLPAGAELASIIYLNEGSTVSPDRNVTEVPFEFVLRRLLYIKVKPFLNKKHIFKIEVTKSNGEVYIVNTEEITFE